MTMNTQSARVPAIVATALIATIILQILYMALLGGPQPADPSVGMTNADIAGYFTERWGEVALVWTLEAVAFVIIALGGLAQLRSSNQPLGWGALALFGVFNLVQIGIGLALFKPVALAGEEATWMFWAIVGGAFAFYFIAKIFIGLAALVFGLALMARGGGTAARTAGGLAMFAGLAATIANIAALGTGMGWLMLAGATGTLAALMVAIAVATLRQFDGTTA